MEVHLQIADLVVGYRKKQIGTTFSVQIESDSGQLVLLVGRNGSGKSTLLRTLAGLQHNLSGEIRLNGEALRDMDVRKRATLISYVHTRPPDFTDLSVGEVVALGAYPLALDASDDAVIEELDRLRIAHLNHHRLDSISDGERQKAMIARAMLQDTPVILMDEPTAFLDYPSRIEWWKHVDHMRNSGKVIIVSTHDLAMVKDVAVDSFWLLDREGEFFTELQRYEEVLQQLSLNS